MKKKQRRDCGGRRKERDERYDKLTQKNHKFFHFWHSQNMEKFVFCLSLLTSLHPKVLLDFTPLPKNKSPKYWLFSSSALERRGGVKSDKNTNLSIFENVLKFFLFFGFRKMYFYFRKNLILPIMIMELWRWEWKRSSGTAAERLRRKKEGSRWEVW